MSKVTEGLIYERVDDTVYARDPNQPEKERWIVSGGPESKPDWYLDNYEIVGIFNLAEEGNKTLQKMLRDIKITYQLSKTDD